MSRFDKMSLWWPYEAQNGHTKSTRKWTFANNSVIFLACQRFCLRSQNCCRSLENTTGGHSMGKDCFANGPMFHDQTRIWTFSFLCVHLLSNSGQCDASKTFKFWNHEVILLRIKNSNTLRLKCCTKFKSDIDHIALKRV